MVHCVIFLTRNELNAIYITFFTSGLKVEDKTTS